MNKERIAIITEGDVREIEVFESIKNIFFQAEKVDVISFPAGENIYMLWKQLKKDSFQTDIIELIREQNEKASEIIENYSRDDFSEVYLFFDYDGHQNNLTDEEDAEKVLEQMLHTFNNETENGLLYINYPMVESVRDYNENDCSAQTKCYLSIDELSNYKKLSAGNVYHNNFSKYTIEDWGEIMDCFTRRVSCLAQRELVFSYEEYKEIVTSRFIYDLQLQQLANKKVFVLCAFPEFLLDYNREKFWHRMVKHGKNKRRSCSQINSCAKI